jgi:hypothetical protein
MGFEWVIEILKVLKEMGFFLLVILKIQLLIAIFSTIKNAIY